MKTFFKFKGVNILLKKIKCKNKSNFNFQFLIFVLEIEIVFEGLLNPNNTFGTFFHLNTITIRREALKKANLKFNENLRVHQDQDFITKLAYHLYLKTGNITSAIAIRGVHEDNRITKIKLYSSEYNTRQHLLWNSLWSWAKEKIMDNTIKKHIQLQQKSFELSQKKGISKYISLLIEIPKNPMLLKTRYRFTYTP